MNLTSIPWAVSKSPEGHAMDYEQFKAKLATLKGLKWKLLGDNVRAIDEQGWHVCPVCAVANAVHPKARLGLNAPAAAIMLGMHDATMTDIVNASDGEDLGVIRQDILNVLELN